MEIVRELAYEYLRLKFLTSHVKLTCVTLSVKRSTIPPQSFCHCTLTGVGNLTSDHNILGPS